MDSLIRTRATIKGKLTRFQNHLSALQALHEDADQTVSNKQVLELQKRNNNASAFLSEYESVHAEITQVTDDASLAEQDFSEFESAFFSAMGQAEDLISKLVGESPNRSGRSSPSGSLHSYNSATSQRSPAFKLPKINIPKFSGDIENWVDFKNFFPV